MISVDEAVAFEWVDYYFLFQTMKVFLATLCLFLLASCEPGLTPPPEVEPGLGGTILFEKGTWPRQDSLFNLWVFASKIYPLDSSKIFTGLFSEPPAIYIHPSFEKNLPFFVDSTVYSFALPAGTYKYIGVLQRFREEISVGSLRVVGLYGSNSIPPEPLQVTVEDFQFVRGVNMKVNFHKPPRQPF
ncbi:MAG TPA: hypothetical protein DCP63_01985 [Bacteroidetes bacterium]|nr:hypothetical protein [Bacteroidota bacterium]